MTTSGVSYGSSHHMRDDSLIGFVRPKILFHGWPDYDVKPGFENTIENFSQTIDARGKYL